ncbi:MAG TPA: hypothetical protein ENF74_02490 [Firmicutes bacterium]|nr:hypothetical protein [Bacillota bacterium]
MRKRVKAWVVKVKNSRGGEYVFKAEVLGEGKNFLLLSCGNLDPEKITLPLDETAIEELYHELKGILAEVKAEED